MFSIALKYVMIIDKRIRTLGEIKTMKVLEDYIVKYGHVPCEHVLKVDSFLNHQIDAGLMMQLANDFKEHFKDKKITKIVTIETSGIAPSVFLGYILNVPVVYMKKNNSRIMDADCYHTNVHSFTKNVDYELIVSKKFINQDDSVIFIDDFMANGEAALGAIRILEEAKASIAGIGIVIEKAFQKGRARVEELGYEVYSQARVASLEDWHVTFVEE